MNPHLRIALGIASVLPAVVLLALATVMTAGHTEDLAPDVVRLIAGAGFVGMVGGLTAIGTFVLRTVQDIDHGIKWKLGWVVGLSAFGVLTAPAYWFVYVRKEKSNR